MGRPSKASQWITEDGLSLLSYWKRNDLTDEQIAEKIGIRPPTFVDWKRKYPQINEALKKGLEYAVADAEKAIIEKFKTQTIIEEREETWEDGDSKRIHRTVTKKQILPDTTAIIFFLKAKAGWRDNVDLSKALSAITPERRKEIEDALNAE